MTASQTSAIATSTRSLATAINRIVDAKPAAPSGEDVEVAGWLRECDDALHRVRAASPLLRSPDAVAAPLNSNSYFTSLAAVTDAAKMLGDGMRRMAMCAKREANVELVGAVSQAADAVCSLAEHAAQSAFLIGRGDAQTQRGREAPFDARRLGSTLGTLRASVQTIADGAYTSAQLINHASTIASDASTIATICREASEAASAVTTRRHFVSSAAEITQMTSALIGSVKSLDAQPANAERRRDVSARAADLEHAAEALETFVDRPDFSPGITRISEAGRRAQLPVLDAGRRMLHSSAAMIGTARSLVQAPADKKIWQVCEAAAPRRRRRDDDEKRSSSGYRRQLASRQRLN